MMGGVQDPPATLHRTTHNAAIMQLAARVHNIKYIYLRPIWGYFLTPRLYYYHVRTRLLSGCDFHKLLFSFFSEAKGGVCTPPGGATPHRLVGTSDGLPSRALGGHIRRNGGVRPCSPPCRGGTSGWRPWFLGAAELTCRGQTSVAGRLWGGHKGRNRPRSSPWVSYGPCKRQRRVPTPPRAQYGPSPAGTSGKMGAKWSRY